MKFWIFFITFFVFLSTVNASNIVYPIWKMSKPECRFQDYSTLWDECKQDLPILKTSDYNKYKNNYWTYRRVYTVLWGWSYDYWWDVWNWWHQWVDIATAKWTPVLAMTDWKVLRAKEIAWWRWLTVKIEHTINGRKIYSNYSHLSKIDVVEWQTVKTWQKVWEVWSTWNSTWNHLHFQIDITKASWPRYRTKCSEKNYNKIINWWACFDELSQNTLDPLYFLETKWTIVKSETIIDKPKTEIISTVWLISNEEILRREINEFLERYELKAEIQQIAWNLELSKPWILKISVYNKYTKKPFNGNFPWNMSFKYDNKKINLFPTWIFAIDKWFRDINITANASWYQTIDIYIWESFVSKVTIWVLNPAVWLTPFHTSFNIPDKNVISDINQWSLYFKTKEWISLLWSKFVWNYYLTSSDKSIKFCIKKPNSIDEIDILKNNKCSEFNFVHETWFNYSNTVDWILVFDYKITWTQKTQIQIQNAKWETLAFYTVTPELPQNLRKEYKYYNEMIEMWKVWIISGVNNGYYMEDRDLTMLDWLSYIRNTLAFLKTNCKSDICKQTINSRISELKKHDKPQYSKVKLNRIQFITLVAKFIPSTNQQFQEVVYRDVSAAEQKIINMVTKNYLWKDVYWQSRYFQTKNVITRWEAAYVIYNYIK